MVGHTPQQHPTLIDGVIHIWRVPLEQSPATIASLKSLLIESEVQRAGRFYFARDQRRYTVARGALRLLLGRYLDQVPSLLKIDYTKYSKPFLTDSSLKFNVSHSGEMALIGFVWGREIGVDVEFTGRVIDDAPAIAQRFFSANENVVFQQVPLHLQQTAFYNCWTRKEAYIKAIGEGLSHPLDTFDVTLRPGEPAKFLSISNDPVLTSQWSLTAIDPGRDYIAAIAIKGAINPLHLYDFPAISR